VDALLARRPSLPATSPAEWLQAFPARLAVERGAAAIGPGSSLRMSELLADDGRHLRLAHERLRSAGGVPARPAAMYLVGWFAGSVAQLVGFGAAAGGFGLVVDPTSILWDVLPSGYPVRAAATGSVLVADGHPWQDRPDVEVVSGGELRRRCRTGLVAACEPIVEVCRGLARVGRVGLWNEVADALGGALQHQGLVPVDEAVIGLLDLLVDPRGMPWGARPRLGLAPSRLLGRVHVVQKGGCCLAYTCPPATTDAPDVELDEARRAFRDRFPVDAAEPSWCSTCSLRPAADCEARQVVWAELQTRARDR
jgi:hypothetical protein